VVACKNTALTNSYKISMRTLRRSQKLLRERGLEHFCTKIPSNKYARREYFWQTINRAKFTNVVDQIESGFEPQSAIFETVQPLSPLDCVAKELDDYSHRLMKMPIVYPITFSDDLEKHCGDEVTVDDVLDQYEFTDFDPSTLVPDPTIGSWYISKLTNGPILTRLGMSRYRHAMADFEMAGQIPLVTYLVNFQDAVAMVVLLEEFYEPHSGPADATIGDNGLQTHTDNQQITFGDSDAGYNYHIEDFVDDVRKSRDERVAMFKDFLKRPIRLNAYNWPVGSDFSADINPWDDYLANNTRINNRISFFNIVRGKLCVKFVVSGTGFHYGRILVSYMPLHRYDDLSGFSNLIPENIVQQSQLPHIFINPTTSSGGTMCLPFFFHEDYANITLRDWLELGNLQVRSVGNLKHANGANDNVSIMVFAWMEDIEVSVPTSVDAANLAPQDGFEPHSGTEQDEANKEGMISGPATKIAGMASAMSSVPVIGPYASATSTVASSVASIAKVLGLSRPNQTKNVEPFKPEVVSSLSLTTVPDRSAKITVDDKQELTIDPRISGVGGSDPLDIKAIAQKESYLTNFLWAKSSNINDVLFQSRVQPCMFAESAVDVYHLTSLGFVSLPFKYWTGTLKFRFQIVCSAYHKGRLKFTYDPNYINFDVNDDYATNYSQIIDISHTQDFTISITPGQATTLMKMAKPGFYVQNDIFTGFDGITPVTRYNTKEKYVGNGVVEISVINELTTPNSTTNNDVQINVYVSAGDDFEVFVPTNDINDYEFIPLGFDAQSGVEVNADAIGTKSQLDKPLQDDYNEFGLHKSNPKLNEIYTGERITNLRPLLKRFTKWRSVTTTSGVLAGLPYEADVSLPCFPPIKGDYTGALDASTGSTSGFYSYVNMTFLQYIVAGFQGHRGSVRWKIVPHNTEVRANWLKMQREFDDDGSPSYGVVISNGKFLLSNNPPGFARDAVINEPTYLSGGLVTHGMVNSAMEFELPYQNQLRFHPGKRLDWTAVDEERYATQPRIDITMDLISKGDMTGANLRGNYLDFLVAGGEDYQCYFFTGLPPIRFRPVPPAV